MNETNNNQKPKISRLAIASIIYLGLYILLKIVGFLNGRLFYIEWPTWLYLYYRAFAVPYILFLAAPILGIAALINIGRSKWRLRGEGLAKAAIIIPFVLLCLYLVLVFVAGFFLMGPM